MCVRVQSAFLLHFLCIPQAFIIKLYECYNSSRTLYFLMAPALGGELYATYNRKGFHGSEKHGYFYSAGQGGNELMPQLALRLIRILSFVCVC